MSIDGEAFAVHGKPARVAGLVAGTLLAAAFAISPLRAAEDGLPAPASAAVAAPSSTPGLPEKSLEHLEQAIAALRMRIDKLEQETARPAQGQDAGGSLRQAAAILARAEVIRAAQGSQPFTAEFAALKVAAPEDPEIPTLEPIASVGAPTRTELAQEFRTASRSAIAADIRAQFGDSIWGRLWGSFGDFIAVRRAGDVSAGSARDRLAGAADALNRDDLAAAVAAVGALDGAAATVMAAWLKQAEARLRLDRSVADMRARLLAAFAATGRGSP